MVSMKGQFCLVLFADPCKFQHMWRRNFVLVLEHPEEHRFCSVTKSSYTASVQLLCTFWAV